MTGDRRLNRIDPMTARERDDAKVSVKGVTGEAMADFLVLHVFHAFIMTDKDVIINCLYVLNGRFKGIPG